jgi:hypothetical protein
MIDEVVEIPIDLDDEIVHEIDDGQGIETIAAEVAIKIIEAGETLESAMVEEGTILLTPGGGVREKKVERMLRLRFLLLSPAK